MGLLVNWFILPPELARMCNIFHNNRYELHDRHSDRYVIIVLKASGKDERNSKYVVKLVIIMEYRCETVLE